MLYLKQTGYHTNIGISWPHRGDFLKIWVILAYHFDSCLVSKDEKQYEQHNRCDQKYFQVCSSEPMHSEKVLFSLAYHPWQSHTYWIQTVAHSSQVTAGMQSCLVNLPLSWEEQHTERRKGDRKPQKYS